MTNDLGMQSVVSDSALYAKFDDSTLAGFSEIQVDDCLNAGKQSFERLTQKALKRIESKPRVYDSFDYFGTHIQTIAPQNFSVGQPYYAKHMTFLPKDTSFDEFRKHRVIYSWPTNTKADVAFCANRAAQVSNQTFSKEKVNELNRGIKRMQQNVSKALLYPKLILSSLQFRVYADATFATNDDLLSQLGYISMLCDDSNKFHYLEFSSKKSKRVVRFVMAAEVYSFMNAFDAMAVVVSDYLLLLKKSVLVYIFTDSKQIFDAITRGKRTTKKRLMIDIKCAREAYKKFEVSAIGLVRRELNLADGLTKENDNGVLDMLLHTGVDITEVELWIERNIDATNSD